MTSDYFYLVFSDESHSLLFYTLWDQYVWESQSEGVDVNILMAKNQQWADTTNLSVLGRCMGDKYRSTARDFLQYLDARSALPHLGR